MLMDLLLQHSFVFAMLAALESFTPQVYVSHGSKLTGLLHLYNMVLSL